MGYYEYDKINLERIATAQDEDAKKNDNKTNSNPKDNPYLKQAEVNKDAESKTHRSPKEETLAEHMKHCKAEPGNCPFVKAFKEIDNLSPTEIKVTKQMVYDRLAVAMTQLFALGSDVAKTAIDDDSDSAKNVTDAIESGIEKIKDLCEKRGCKVNMDDAGSKYIIIPPSN